MTPDFQKNVAAFGLGAEFDRVIGAGDRLVVDFHYNVTLLKTGLGWSVDGANRHDSMLLESTLDAASERGLLDDVETLWLDRGYDSGATRARLAGRGIDDAVIAKKRTRGKATTMSKAPMGLRWPVERTNSWLSNYGQLRRNTDRKAAHRLAQFALAVTLLLVAKLIDWRNRWAPLMAPIR